MGMFLLSRIFPICCFWALVMPKVLLSKLSTIHQFLLYHSQYSLELFFACNADVPA